MTAAENITILFTDLVGSTELSSSFPPDTADELRRTHFAILREAIAATGGDEVKNLGDGLMVGFSGTTPSLACAVAMQQAVARHNRRAPVSLAVRIGISTGDVTVEDSDFFGEPVVEAARLCAAAQGGQILTTEVVKALARRRGFRFVSERELELKGFPDPVVAWEVLWESPEEDASGIPLPPRLPQVPAIGVVGRVQERELLLGTLKTVSATESSRVVLISGEAGVGKSTLTSSFAREAHADGAVVLYGRCDEDLVVPYRSFVEALTHYLTHVEDGALSELGDEYLASLIRLVPALRKRRPDLEEIRASDPDAERWLVYGAVVALIEKASCDAPFVLLLDDLQWADRPTLQLLRHVSTNPVGRVLIIGTYRDTELSASDPLLEALAAFTREQSVIRMSLSGFENDEVVLFLEAAAGHELDEAGLNLAHSVYHETDGNPFFVAEVLRHLVERRAIVQDDTGRWIPAMGLSEVGLPESLRQVIGSRVARLGDEASRVLSAASVLGQEFEVNLLSVVVRSEEDAVLDVLEAAGSAALVAEVRATPGRFRFAHALIQHTLYEDLGVTRRARLHLSAAEALEARFGDEPGARAGELARHWLAAIGPQESAKAVRYAQLAGDSALEALAPAEAIRWYTEALGLLAQGTHGKERARCLVGLGEAQRQAGDRTYRETLLEAARLARDVGEVDTLVRAALGNNRGVPSAAGEVDAERVGALEAALEALDRSDSTARARLLAHLAHERVFGGDYVQQRALADEALAMARRLEDPATLLDVLLRRSQTIAMPDTVDELLAEGFEAEALAAQLGDPVGTFWASAFRSAFSLQKGHVAEAGRCIEECARIASEVGQPILKWITATRRSLATLLVGDIEAAEKLANESLQIGIDTGQPDALTFYGSLLLQIRWHQGRIDEIADIVSQLANDNPGLSVARGAAAFVLVESGRHSEATQMLEQEKESGFSVHDDFLLLFYLDLWARVASGLNDRVAADALYDRLAPWPRSIAYTPTAVNGAVVHNLGTLATVLDRFAVAGEHFAQALEIHEGLNEPFLVALTQLEWGRMLLCRQAPNDAVHAGILLHSAVDLARHHGYSAIEQRALAALSTMN